jgi:molybdopterin converting factor small subunit
VTIVRIPSPLRALSGGRREVAVAGLTLSEALLALERECPGIESRLRAPDGALLPYVNLYVDGNDARLVGGLQAPLRAGSIIDVVPAVSGGARI